MAPEDSAVPEATLPEESDIEVEQAQPEASEANLPEESDIEVEQAQPEASEANLAEADVVPPVPGEVAKPAGTKE